MAAKLKKRAMAELAAAANVKEEPMDVGDGQGHGGGGGDLHGGGRTHTMAEAGDLRMRMALVAARGRAASAGGGVGGQAWREHLSAVEDASRDPREVSAALSNLQATLSDLSAKDGGEAMSRLCASALRPGSGVETRERILLALQAALKQLGEVAAMPVRSHLERWLDQVANEKSPRVLSAVFGLLRCLYREERASLPVKTHERIHAAATDRVGHLDTTLATNALSLAGLSATKLQDRGAASRTMSLLGKYAQSPDPRVRHAAFSTLRSAGERGHRLDVALYWRVCRALGDDFEGVRSVALELVHYLACEYPEEKVRPGGGGRSGGGSVTGGRPVGSQSDQGSIRLVDDAFSHICYAINDLSVMVRELAANLMGKMEGVSQEFLEQTLDKKLMSNMRVKKSAHEREAKMVSSGEWSTGKKWADDAPKEELDADSVNLMSFGACGAFIHGLEDELSCVRTAAVESLTALSIRNARLAAMALDFLVDMFNDEIEAVRLKAIESLKRIAPHILLQVHQLETVLAALDDFSLVVRERLHGMLQSCRVATKDGLQAVVAKLLENLKKYPQDRRSILYTFKRLGERHSELTLPLTTLLLEIHPFLDTAEPDIDDPAYLCILVLVFNASQHCSTLEPLMDAHTKRHFYFMVDTYPHLMPEKARHLDMENVDGGAVGAWGKENDNWATGRFLRETLKRVRDSEHMGMAARICLLQRASKDLARVAQIEPTLAGFAHFADLYLQCQALFLKALSSRFWVNPSAMPAQQLSIVETNLDSLSKLSTELSCRFSRLSPSLKTRVQQLEIHIQALKLVYLVRASNKSALQATEQFHKQVASFSESADDSTILSSPFISSLIRRLTEMDDYKPGMMVRTLQPLLLACPLETLVLDADPASSPSSLPDVAMARAVIYEPAGMNETPLKYTAGMVLAVPVDAEVFDVPDTGMVRLAIKTPDQRVQLVTPKQSQFMPKEDEEGGYRLLTDALMSHQVWSEALHVEISVVLDVSDTCGESPSSASGGRRQAPSSSSSRKEPATVPISKPTKVFVLPKPIKRGI